jgi:CRP/FNR family cyclic AMP-dependent transcriptional regulator
LREGVKGKISLSLGEIFEGLAPAAFEEFQLLGERRAYPRGSILFRIGDTCAGIFWIVSGRVRTSTGGAEGISQLAQPGEILGLKEALCGEAYSLSAETDGPAEVSFVSLEDLSAFLAGHPDAAFRIVQRLSGYLGLILEHLRSALWRSNPSN